MKKVLETFLLSLSVSIENVLNTPEISEKLKEFNITKEILLGIKTFANEFNVILKIAFEDKPELLNTILIKNK